MGIFDFFQEKEHIKKENQNLKQEIKNLKIEIQKKEKSNDFLKEIISNRDNEIDKLKSENKRYIKKNNELKTKIECLNRNIDKLNSELEKSQRLLKQDNDFNKVYNFIKQGKSVFITGGAGTGKSYILQQLKEYIPELKNNITSTTGISAININGATIHSWAGLGKIDFDYDKLYSKEKREKQINDKAENLARYAKKNIKEKIRETKMIAIDEISMLSDDLFRLLDLYFQKIRNSILPFGGIQMILIGDFCQLPPVINKDDKSPDLSLHYAFFSESWENLNLTIISLKTFHRQKKDKEFAQHLNNLRLGKNIDEAEKFLSDCIIYKNNDDKNVIHVYQSNNEVKNHNNACLKQIEKDYFTKDARDYFVQPVENDGQINYEVIKDRTVKETDYIYNGEDQIEKDTKSAKNLTLKICCKVMVIKNLDVEKGIANGSIGYISAVENDLIYVDFENIKNYPIKREEFIYYNKYKKEYIMRRQFPLMLAYAITIHKSQGLTVDKIVVDINKTSPLYISPGQVYVAFSRVRTKEGLKILKAFPKDKIKTDSDVRSFYEKNELNT